MAGYNRVPAEQAYYTHSQPPPSDPSSGYYYQPSYSGPGPGLQPPGTSGYDPAAASGPHPPPPYAPAPQYIPKRTGCSPNTIQLLAVCGIIIFTILFVGGMLLYFLVFMKPSKVCADGETKEYCPCSPRNENSTSRWHRPHHTTWRPSPISHGSTYKPVCCCPKKAGGDGPW